MSALAPPLAEAVWDSDRSLVSVVWSDGYRAEFAPAWLKQNAPGARLASGQSLVDPTDLPSDLEASNITTFEKQAVIIDWNDGSDPSSLSTAWLRKHAQPTDVSLEIEIWQTALDQRLPQAEFKSWIDHDDVLLNWLLGYQQFGIALLCGVPCIPNAIEQVARRFAMIRETNYGTIFSVKLRADPENLADSSAGLPLHTDNPYRDPPPDAQILHCLQSDTEGGESQFADGFAAVQRLADQDPQAYATLCQTPIRFRYEAADAILEANAPVIELDASGSVKTLRFNNRSMSPKAQPAAVIAEFYRAFLVLHQQLHREDSMIQFKLTPGDLVLMNNRRLLHGRSAFTKGGDRHLRGCYLHGDSIRSALDLLRKQKTNP